MTDAELNEAVCKRFGIEPKREWMISKDGGKSLSAATDRINGPWYTRKELEDHLKKHKEEYPNSYMSKSEVVEWLIYPDLRHDNDAAVELYGILAEKWDIIVKPFESDWSWIYPPAEQHCKFQTFAEAVFAAALAIVNKGK
jgi:hypothetical protein